MNTKALFILVILISINASKGIGQTKLDTEYWINSKFVTYKLSTYFISDDNFKLQITPDYLSFDECFMTLKTTLHNRIGPNFEQTYELKIGDIKSIIWKKNTLIFSSKKYNINHKGRMIGEKEFEHINFLNSLEFEINGNAEPKLRERMIKAFNHLKIFCKSSNDENEPF